MSVPTLVPDQFIINPSLIKGADMGLLYCVCCGVEIVRRSQNPDQTFCSKKRCQTERKQRWRAQKRLDSDFLEAARLAAKKWRDRNRDYMRGYREEHPEYVAKNRCQQDARNHRRDGKDEKTAQMTVPLIVKSDAWEPLGDMGSVKKDELPEGIVIVKSDASNPLVPMLLVPMSMAGLIVNATRQGASG